MPLILRRARPPRDLCVKLGEPYAATRMSRPYVPTRVSRPYVPTLVSRPYA